MPYLWVMRIMRVRTAHHGIILSRSVLLLLRDVAILILITLPSKIHVCRRSESRFFRQETEIERGIHFLKLLKKQETICRARGHNQINPTPRTCDVKSLVDLS